MAAGTDDLTLHKRVSRDMRLPPTPPQDDSDEHKTGLQTPPMHQSQQLLTPDITPPGMILQPPRPVLSRDPSSRADSFSTAREQQSREFLRFDAVGSRVEDGVESEDEFVPDDDRHEEVVEEAEEAEDEPWRDIPGAFRSTPSNNSSTSAGRSSKQLSTPSTGSSSDKFVRPKQYLDIESPPSAGSSRELIRARQYRHDTESPSDRHTAYTRDLASPSRESSDSSSSSGVKDWETAHGNGTEYLDDGEGSQREEDHVGQDWEHHVSYLSENGENDSEKEHENEGAAVSARASPSSSRLSGHGRSRKMEKRRVQDDEVPRGVNNPAFPPAGTSNKMAEQGLLKRGSDESSRARSNDTPSPSVSAQKRRQRGVLADGPGRESATPGARDDAEGRRMKWLRQHAGTLASTDIPPEFLAAPPRNSNDMVYKHIQQANMDRFDALKELKELKEKQAAGVAVVVPTEEARNRHLRHVTKQTSLRSMSDNNSSHVPSAGPKRDHSLRHKKALTPQKAPLAGSPKSSQSQPKTRSVSGSHSLRHEKRPLSGTGRPLQSNDSSSVLSHVHESQKSPPKPSVTSKPTPQLRHSSLPIHLDSETKEASPDTSNAQRRNQRRTHALRRSSREYRLENTHPSTEDVPEQAPEQNFKRSSKPTPQKDSDGPKRSPERKDTSTIIETTTFSSPHFLGLAQNHRNRNMGTPMSASAISDSTEMEVREAQNVAFFPHSNDSLLVVQHGSKPEHKNGNTTGKQAQLPTRSRSGTGDTNMQVAPLFSELAIGSPPDIAVNGKSIHTVESPLTNPRDAPIPPILKFIPATPVHEDEKELDAVGGEEAPSTPQRRNSLVKRARRYSDVVVGPLLGKTVTRSHSIRPSPTMSEKRDEKLHPNWVPNSFWQDDEDDYYSDDEDPIERLPAGGDTSEHPQAKFPRNLSKRMPGFRGSGGFLLGNSLGMDRHGTNKRRHYVEPPRNGSDATPVPSQSVRRVASMDSVSSRTSADGRIFAIPGTRTRLQYVGFKPIKDKMKKRRESKEANAREKRRAEIKDQIGMRIVHDA